MERFSFDEAYLRNLREGDFRTEQHFFKYFNPLLLGKVRYRVRTAHLVDDICQETFVRVFKKLRSGDIHSAPSIGAFVNSTCENVLREFSRFKLRDRAPDAEPPDPPDHAADVLTTIVNQENRRMVQKVLKQLPPKERHLLRVVFFEEKDRDEICRELGVDRDYLRVLLHRAIEAFRAAWEKHHRIATLRGTVGRTAGETS